MEKEVIERFVEKHVEIFLYNGLKYTGHIRELTGYTIVFIDKYGEEVPFECSEVKHINPLREEVKNGG